MNRFKIALVCDWFLPQVGGIELHLNDLARHLTRAGHEVHVLTTLPAETTLENGFKIHRLPARLLPKWKILTNRRPFFALREILEREKFDVLHVHSGIISPLAYGSLCLAQQLKIPTVWTNHSLFENTIYPLRFLNLFLRWSHWPLVLSSVSRQAAEGMKKASGRADIEILSNGIDPSEWRFFPQPHPIPRLVSVLRLTRKKRPLKLIALFAKVLERIPAPHRPLLTLIGDGPDRQKIERKIRRLSLESHVELSGFLPRNRIRDIFAKSDIFVMTGQKESFGIAALEARSAGLPVVANSQGAVGEIVQHGHNGFLASNDEEWIIQVVELLRNENLRKKFGERSTQGIEEFAWSRVIEKHLEVYKKARHRTRNYFY